jgi:general secretion pathway protein H
MISRCNADPPRPAAGAAGFTLLEILVVLAIVGFALVLVVGYRPPWSRAFAVDTIAAELSSELRLVRSEAIAENRPVALELDVKGHRYRGGSAAPRPLPASLSIQVLTIAGQRQDAEVGSIRFNPDGSSTGGRIVLAEGARRVAIGVDWLTGRVSVADVR